MEDLANMYGHSDPIAVIGLACRFPKAPDVETFWHNLMNGITGQSYFSEQELNASGISPSVYQRKNFVPSGAVIEKPEYFDAGLFGYSPKEARSIDPQQRLFLQNVWHALEHSGHAPTGIKVKTGIFGSIRTSTYPSFNDFDVTQVGQVKGLQALIGNDKDYLATRVAHKFNLTGPAFTVQTACSSSLVAVHLACESLRSGECNMAIAGGVAVSFPQISGYEYQPGMIFSSDGLCRPFDANADGTFGGHGVGSVVLKRLEDALQDGDNVLAVLRGSAINNDGQDKVGFTAPSVSGQTRVLLEAIHLADIQADDVEMIEAHGTGTKLGDPIEVTAIKQAYQRNSQVKTCYLGSVKSSLGHLDTAAGIASLIKTVLAVSRGKIPASLNITQTNPALQLDDSSFKLAKETIDWHSETRTAAVSSFGIGGTNCHMLVQSVPKRAQLVTNGTTSASDLSLFISANSEASLRDLAKGYGSLLKNNEHFDDVAYSALTSRSTDLPYRLAVNNTASAAEALIRFAKSGQTSPNLNWNQKQKSTKVTWCFTGQGSQFPGMGHELYLVCPTFKASIDTSQTYCQRVGEAPLTEVMFGELTHLLTRTDHAQLAIVAFEIAMAAHWQAKGFEPNMVMGHSVGEFAACVVGGYLSHQQAIELVAERGRLMHECAQQEKGVMLAVFTSEIETQSISALDELDLAARNGCQHRVFSGSAAAVERATTALDANGINFRTLDVPCAAHSRLLDDMLIPFSDFAADISASAGAIPLISSLTGKLLTSENALTNHYWAQHVRQPVQFKHAVESAISQGCTVFLEMGPTPHLTAISQREHWQQDIRWQGTHQHMMTAEKSKAAVLSTLYVAGMDTDWPSQFNTIGHQCELPLYAFDEQKYWYQAETINPVNHNKDSELTRINEPESAAAGYELMRCSAIENFVKSCISSHRFTLKTVILGGRLLPRYRQIVLALLDVLIDNGYYSNNGKWFVRTNKPLPPTDTAAEWLREQILKIPSTPPISMTEIRCLIQASTTLKDKLSSLEHIPAHGHNHVEEANILLHNPLGVAKTQGRKHEPQHTVNDGLTYQDWSSLPHQQDLFALISQQLPAFTQENNAEWEISVSTTFSPNEVTQVAVNRISGMWGQAKYHLRAKSAKGVWQWLGDAYTKDFNSSVALKLLPSPHNHYEWQWQRIAPYTDSQSQTISPLDIEQALLTTGEVHRLNSHQSLVTLPQGSLSHVTAQMAKALSRDFDTLYVLTSDTMPVNSGDDIQPEKFALMSLLRVARAEYPTKKIYLLDVDNHHPEFISSAIKQAPFSLCTELACREDHYFCPKILPAKASDSMIPQQWFTTQGWHLVTGGMGGIGRLVVKWLASSGAKNIAVLGRREHPDWPEFCLQMATLGCTVDTLICDMSQQGQLELVLSRWQTELPIIGAIHAAGTSAHGLLATWDQSATEALLQTKAMSFTALHQWLEAQNAQYLIGFSSAASLGAQGQGTYAVANAYLEGYTLSKKAASHCRLMSIGWGAWDNIGMTSSQRLLDKLSKDGMHTISLQEGLWHLSQCFLNGQSNPLAMNIENLHPNFCRYFADSIAPAIQVATSIVPSTVADKNNNTATSEVSDLPLWLVNRVCYQLGIAESTTVSDAQDLLQLGMDSLQFIELSAAIQKQFGIKINADEAYQDLSVAGLASLINERMRNDARSVPVLRFKIEKQDKHLPFPLTPIQHAYWIGRESWIKYGGIACHVVFEWDKNLNQFDPEKFENAWNALIERHDMLRMTITANGEQIIQANVPHFTISETSVSSLPKNEQRYALDAIRHSMSHDVRPADVWPLFDLRFTRMSDTKIRLHMNLDLLQFDVQSFKIMMDDLTTAYQGLALPEMPLTFRDYVMHEQKLRQQADWQASWDYWQQTIPNLPTAPRLPLNPNYDSESPQFITLEGKLDSTQWQGLKSQWQQWGVTPSAGLLTLFAHTLAKWTSSSDFTLNMTFFNRQPFHEDVEGIIGDFTSVLLMDFMLSAPSSLKQHMSETQEKLWKRLGHSQVNGVEVIRELAKHLKASGKISEREATLPLTPVVFTSMLGMSMDGMDIKQAMTSLLGDPVYVLSQTPQVWLDHQIMEVDGDLVFNWYCMEDVLEHDVLHTMFADYNQQLTDVAANQLSMGKIVLSPQTKTTLSPSPLLQAITLPEITEETAKEVTDAWMNIEHQALVGIWNTLQNHQLFTVAGKHYSLEHIYAQLNVATKHHKLIVLWLDQLSREGMLTQDNHGYLFGGQFPPPPTASIPPANWCQRLSQYLNESIRAHPALLDGSKSALEILFKDSEVTDCLYSSNPSLHILNQSAAETIKAIGGEYRQGINVLEVGAGTASTSQAVLNIASNTIKHYQFTDISLVFLQEAKQTLSAYSQVHYELFDINLPASASVKVKAGYQVILAVNVLHDATDLPKTLRQLHGLLAHGGQLIFIEATDQFSPMQLATVGFIEGINAFNDFRQQQKSAMLNLPAWLALLSENGFVPQLVYPNTEHSVLRQHLVVANSTSVIQPELTATADTLEHDIQSPTLALKTNPGTAVTVAQVWSKMLDREVGQQCDFFQIGGDSLMATKMIVELNQQGFIHASLQLIFEHPVLADFCLAINPTTAESVSIEPELGGSIETDIDTAPHDNEYALTPLQHAYWLGESDLFSLGNGIAHFYAELEIKHLDRERLTLAWNQLIRSHDQLRGVIDNGKYCISKDVPYYQPQYVDLTAMDKARKDHFIGEARGQIVAQGVPTDQWPLFDINILQTDIDTSLVHLVVGLVVADGKSLGTLFQQLQSLYEDLSSALPVPHMTAAAYLRELEKTKASEGYQRAQQYWSQRIPTLPEAPTLPLADSRDEDLSQCVLTHRISQQEWAQIQSTALTNNVLPSMAMLTAFCLVLKTWSETKHFSINILHSNRQPMQSETVVGNLSTTSMLEVDAKEDMNLSTFAHQLQQRMTEDLAHASFDGQQVLTEKNRQNRNFSAGMPIVFNDTVSIGQNKPLTIGKLRSFGAQTPHVYLDCMLIASVCGGIDIKWTIQEHHLKPGVFDAMFEVYVQTVRSLPSANWNSPLCPPMSISQVTSRQFANATKAALTLKTNNGGGKPVQTLCDMIQNGVTDYPDDVAIQQGDVALTYAQVWRSSNALAAQILACEDDRPLIAIVMHKGWEQIISAIAILLAGKAYMPVDASYPSKRIAELLVQSDVCTVITQHHVPTPSACYQTLVPSLDAKAPGGFTAPTIDPSDMAYVIFTSGSTGRPKGVVMDHQAVVNSLLDINARIGLNNHDKVLAISALNFDLSVFDIFSTLSQGARLVIPEISPAQDPEALVRLAASAGITVWNSVPAFAQLLADCLEHNQSKLPQLRHIMMSGDWIPVSLPDRLFKVTPNAQQLSLGGATEVAIWSISYPINKSYANCTSIPYGKPLSNQRLYILDKAFAPCPDWVAGELYIGGDGLAIGYWQDTDKTDAAFITHPHSGIRLYKTGDWGRYQLDGNIEFLGRNDQQVKVNGYRIELGEIETVLRQCPAENLGTRVQDAMVKSMTHPSGGIRLIAYVVYGNNAADNNQHLLDYVRGVLPQYMCPSQIVALDSLPLTANGKVDRNALPSPHFTPKTHLLRQPSSNTELRLAQIWAECLNVESIPANQSFFDLGGNSLIAVHLINQINTQLDVSLTAGQLQANDTIERLATLTESQDSTAEQVPILLTPHCSDKHHNTLFIIHPIGGHLLSYQRLASQLNNVTLYGLQYPEHKLTNHEPDIQALARDYLRMIQTIQPQGPYQLAGWSFGGVVAYELAHQMSAQGHEVTNCLLIDSYKPSMNEASPLDDSTIRQHFYADCVGRFPELAEAEVPDFSQDAIFFSSMATAFDTTTSSGLLDIAIITSLLSIYRRNLRAMLSYSPPMMNQLSVTLFAAAQPSHLDFMSYQHPEIANRACHGWQDCCAPRVNLIPGDHYTMLQDPNVASLAQEISQLLARPQQQIDSIQNSSKEVLEHE